MPDEQFLIQFARLYETMHGKKTVEHIVQKVEEHYLLWSEKELDRETRHGTQGSDQGVAVVVETQII